MYGIPAAPGPASAIASPPPLGATTAAAGAATAEADDLDPSDDEREARECEEDSPHDVMQHGPALDSKPAVGLFAPR